MKDIRVVGLAKAFGKTPAVDHVQFDVPAGSLATLLGPSGCGKTTTLRLIAGLKRPDAGLVYVGERLLTFLHDRLRPRVPGAADRSGGVALVPLAFIVGFFVVFGALPFVVLLLNSFMEISGFLGWEMLTTSTGPTPSGERPCSPRARTR